MALTEKQRATRRQSLGSSDLAPILGVDRFRSAADVYLEKTGDLAQLDTNEAMDIGNMCEGVVLDWAEKQLGAIERSPEIHLPDLYYVDHADGVIRASGEPIEVKVEGICGPLRDGWGDAGSDDVPVDVITQCHGHMLATGAATCYVPTLLGGRGRVMFEVPRDESLSNNLAEVLAEWWTEHVLAGRPPEGDPPHIETLKRLVRTSGPPAPIDAALYDAFAEARQLRLDARKAEELLYDKIVDALGTSNWGADATGRRVTYLEQSSRRVDTQALRDAGLYNQYSKVSTPRVLRLPKSKT